MGEGRDRRSRATSTPPTPARRWPRSRRSAPQVDGVERSGGRADDPRIDGVGLRGAASAAIDVGNAGTLLRLLPGWLAGQDGGAWTLDGDDSIRRRPVDRIAEPLRLMGADLRCREDRLPPLEVEGAPLRGIDYELPVASAQVKSCLLFAGLLAEGETRIVEPLPTRDHTERMLAAAGADLDRERRAPSPYAPLSGSSPARSSSRATSPLPPSSSSPPCSIPGSDADARPGSASTRPAPDCSRSSGGWVPRSRSRRRVSAGGSRSATLRVGARSCAPAEVGGAEVPLAIDELPLVALAGCFAEGNDDDPRRRRAAAQGVGPDRDRGRGAERARRPTVEATEDGMAIEGSGGLRGGVVDSHGDHRIAMLGAIAGLASREGVEVDGMDAAAVSYPRLRGRPRVAAAGIRMRGTDGVRADPLRARGAGRR